MKRVYLANDPVSANVLKLRLEENGIQAIVQDERTHELRGEVPLVYPSVWVGNEDEAAAREIALEFSHPQHGEPWTCQTCGEVLEASFADCWKCEQAPRDDGAIRAKTADRPHNLVRIILLFVLLVILFGIYRAYQHESFSQHFLDGYKHQNNGRPEKAIIEYDQALSIRPNDIDVLMNRGLAWSSTENFPKAIVDFNRVVNLNPRAEGIYEARASAHAEMGNASLALKDYLTALSDQPFRTQLKVSVMATKYELGDLEGAWSESEVLRTLENYKYDAARFRSMILDERNKPSEALREADLAISIDPETPDAYMSKADLLVDRGDYQNALALCDKCLSLKKDDFFAMITRGEILMRMSRLKEAHASMRFALSVSTQNRYEIAGRVIAYSVLEDRDAAEREVNLLLNRFPESRWSYISAAEVAMWFAGDTDKALAYLEESKKRGFIGWHLLKVDPFLKDLTDHPRFKKLAGLP